MGSMCWQPCVKKLSYLLWLYLKICIGWSGLTLASSLEEVITLAHQLLALWCVSLAPCGLVPTSAHLCLAEPFCVLIMCHTHTHQYTYIITQKIEISHIQKGYTVPWGKTPCFIQCWWGPRLSIVIGEWAWEEMFVCVAQAWSAEDILGTPNRRLGCWLGEIESSKGCKHPRVLSVHEVAQELCQEDVCQRILRTAHANTCQVPVLQGWAHIPASNGLTVWA